MGFDAGRERMYTSSKTAVATTTDIALFLVFEASIKISCHQQRSPPWGITYGPDYAIYGVCIVWGQVISHDEPAPTPQHHLKSDNIWSVLLVALHR